MAENDDLTRRLYATTDAAVWAREFKKILDRLYNIDADEGWLIGWFANAIETAKTHTRGDHQRPGDRTIGEEDFVILPRHPLFEFFGEVALPPGSGAPSDTPCAPIAERITAWVNEHDLADLYFAAPAPPSGEERA